MKKQSFNENWVFHKKDEIETSLVTLPHDAQILEKRQADAPGGAAHAYFPGGIYLYEKTFDVPESWIEQTVQFQFEGVYKNAKVYLNGKEAGGCAYGYSPFFVDADKFLKYGEQNIIRVEADNSDLPNSRWYTGAGIYRPVWLWQGSKEHIKAEGVHISTLSYSPARIRVKTTCEGGSSVEVSILYKGEKVAHAEGMDVEIDIPNAYLWDEYTPNLYECHVTLMDSGSVLDEVKETFGIRMVEWSNKGLFVNGKETLLRGACVHHDNGILGARSYAESEERRVSILKKAGYNSIRSSHNLASKAMLAACDKYGVYMIDETWDMWYFHKTKYDYASNFMEHYCYDIESMIRRDYNHPSVIMYSICNEISEPKDAKGIELGREIVKQIKTLDPTRAVTGGVNLFIIQKAAKGNGVYSEDGSGRSDEKEKQKKEMSSLVFNILATKIGTSMNKMANSNVADQVTTPFLDMLDISGYNYASGRYPLEGKKHPQRIIVGSETFPQDIWKNWEMVKKYPYLIGDFMWTGWDYIGEAGMGGWNYNKETGFEKPYPWILADGGAIDILGDIGAEAEYAATVWGLRKKPYIGVRPVNHPGVRVTKAVWRGTNAISSWAWQNCEGNKAMVEVYTDAYLVELLLNGKRVGRKKVKKCKAIFKTRYRAGVLKAIAYDKNGNEISQAELSSATGQTHIVIKPEKKIVMKGEVLYVSVMIAGENGVVESAKDTKLHVSISGGELLAFGSANPRTEETYNSGSFTTYYGRAQAVIRAGDNNVVIRVKGENLEERQETIVVK